MNGEKKLNFEECKKCHDIIQYENEDTYWDENGSGYSSKLIKCPKCGTVSVLKYEEDYGFDQNKDERYFFLTFN